GGGGFQETSGSKEGTTAEEQWLNRLTSAERMVLRVLAGQRTSKEIAAELNISVRTVDSHKARIALKLGLSGWGALLIFAVEHKLEISRSAANTPRLLT